ncbi:MAG: diaminopimelate epimerase, partial [Candidatus Zixiibacteriota bacterium]
LLNDFIVIEDPITNLSRSKMTRLAQKICQRRSGVGADGVLLLKSQRRATARIDVYNADGGWAEKSGNGLRIAGLHLSRTGKGKRHFDFEMGGKVSQVRLVKKTKAGAILTTDLGVPEFRSKKVPIRSKSPFMINQTLKMDGVALPVTCLSIGNPHTVVFVENFDFDWGALGESIENHRSFPNKTNVEFAKVLSRRKLQLCEWERGVGATGSSGTGAAAAVAAAVVLGLAERQCAVQFDSGTLIVNWRQKDNVLELTGPAELVCEGIFEFV